MTDMKCENAKDRLPGLVRGDLPPGRMAEVMAHAATCADCRQEIELLSRLRGAFPVAPAGLVSDIEGALARDRSRVRWSMGWRLSAAATIVLALGTAVVWQRVQTPLEASLFAQDPLAIWPADDALVAGAPMLEDLSEDDLALLLEELGG